MQRLAGIHAMNMEKVRKSHWLSERFTQSKGSLKIIVGPTASNSSSSCRTFMHHSRCWPVAATQSRTRTCDRLLVVGRRNKRNASVLTFNRSNHTTVRKFFTDIFLLAISFFVSCGHSAMDSCEHHPVGYIRKDYASWRSSLPGLLSNHTAQLTRTISVAKDLFNLWLNDLYSGAIMVV